MEATAQRENPATAAAAALSDAASPGGTLLIGVGIHIEPFGETAQGVTPQPRARDPKANGARKRPDSAQLRAGPDPSPRRPDYHDSAFFERHVRDLEELAVVVSRHRAKLTVQAQSPFTQVAVERKEPVLKNLAEAGHEIALHFHEDAHLGRGSESLPVERWTAVLRQELDLLERASGVRPTFLSGGNLYRGVLDAAAEAGLKNKGDYKNPRTQRSDPALLTVHPWRPAGGPADGDLAAYTRHDPNGKVVFLPLGCYPDAEFGTRRRVVREGGAAGFFDYVTRSLEASLKAARSDRVSVFHLTLHPGELSRGRKGEGLDEFDRWLTEVVDPLVVAGRVRWATFSEMGDAYLAWEKTHPGIDPRGTAVGTQPAPAPSTPGAGGFASGSLPLVLARTLAMVGPGKSRSSPAALLAREIPPPAVDSLGFPARPVITFAINVHDIKYPERSAEALSRAVELCIRYGVRGEFYFTAPVLESLVEARPDLIAKIRETGMGVSYHVRAPHPLATGFESALAGLSGEALTAVLRDYETYRLDLVSGELERSRPGGYAFAAATLGRPPSTVGIPTRDPRLRAAALSVYQGMGAKVMVAYHESGTDPEEPYRWRNGLLERPSDFSVTRWVAADGSREQFWWNMLLGRFAAEFNPRAYLDRRLGSWQGPRAPFVTALIHDDNFYRRGGTPWALSFYAREKGPALSPPFDLGAPDPSRERTAAEQDALWRAYEELVAHAASQMTVATSEEIAGWALAWRARGA